MATEVEVVSRFYAAIRAGNLDGVAACFAADGAWHLPGTAPISGTHRGWAAIREVVATVLRLSDGTFRAELVDVAVGERYGVAVQHATARRLGRVLDVTACQLIRMSGGVIAEMRGHYSDEAALSSFWQ
ncbi:MAG TPA: nuclear transport factor 2 family protein [Pseudonocardiaceae bacterium]|nr:nuclear transport factor 2 family protein [Pseudonocardiaceae bacterium]